jgi:hypothetical protein
VRLWPEIASRRWRGARNDKGFIVIARAEGPKQSRSVVRLWPEIASRRWRGARNDNFYFITSSSLSA